MRKFSQLLFPMAIAAILLRMAPVTHMMDAFGSARGFSAWFVNIMAVVATLVLMALRASDAIEINMIFMEKGDDGSITPIRIPNSLVRRSLNCVVAWGRFFAGGALCSPSYMAVLTSFFMAPFMMASQAFAMINGFQTWLLQVFDGEFRGMAFPTLPIDMAGRVVEMASGAPFAHPGHLGVPLMVEIGRPVKIRQLVKDYQVRNLLRRDFRRPRARSKARLLFGGLVARMAVFARDARKRLRRGPGDLLLGNEHYRNGK